VLLKDNVTKISIITVCFNSSQTISDCLKSVISQSHKNIEHIIIDGGSNDNTIDLVRQFPHVSRIISEPDNGIYDAMNKGIKLATGDIVGILNSDDFYASEGVLAKVSSGFENSNAMALYGDLQYVDKVQTKKIIRHWKSGYFSSQKFFYGWMPPHPAFFVRRELYEKYGSFDTGFKSSADYELMLRFLVKHDVVTTYLPQVLVKMRTGGQSNATLRNRWRANREDRRAWDVNGLTPYFFTIPLKPLRKLTQFLIKK